MNRKVPVRGYFANSIDAFIPQLWSRESLAILQENMIASSLVNRDFEDMVAQFGETVNTRRPGELSTYRKTTTDDVTVQDVSATNVAVVLNQHPHTSFLIRDGEESKSFMDLTNIYLRPAMLSMARFLDQVVLGQFPQFINNSKGHLGAMTSSNARDYILDVRQKMNTNKAYVDGRNLIVGPSAETEMLKVDLFTSAEKVGDNGTALRNASLGRKLGFDIFMAQNMSTILDNGMTKKTGAINLTAGYVAGDTSLVVDGFTGTLTAGSYCTIAGDDTPLRIASSSATLGNATGIVLASPGLRVAVADNAVIKVYTPGAVNYGAGYDAGYAKAITVDGFTVAPQTGHMIAFGTASDVYTIIGTPTTTSIMLDRPLAADIADDAVVAVTPPGTYSLAFHRNAMTLAVRPLALPKASAGALAGISSFNGLSMRTVITYDGTKQGHLVTMDMLCGIKVLDTNLGAVLLG